MHQQLVNFLGLNVPDSYIAREPLSNRDHSKLFVTGAGVHDKFYNLSHYIDSGDLLILNNTKVQPCRVIAHKKDSGGKVELLFTHKESSYQGVAIYKASHSLKIGTVLVSQSTHLRVIGTNGSKVTVQSDIPLDSLFQLIGHVPLPPYMKRISHTGDHSRYQSIWAQHNGSCAAPTASLHFTDKVINSLRHKGVLIDYCTLHVGLGTFLPVKGSVENHVMHEESYSVSQSLLEKIKQVKQRGNKVIAVGTSVTRALESAASTSFKGKEQTSLFIKPGYQFKVIDRLITNFHQPDSTLILLVQALSGQKEIRAYYREAFVQKYRLYSYGDAMLLENNS